MSHYAVPLRLPATAADVYFKDAIVVVAHGLNLRIQWRLNAGPR